MPASKGSGDVTCNFHPRPWGMSLLFTHLPETKAIPATSGLNCYRPNVHVPDATKQRPIFDRVWGKGSCIDRQGLAGQDGRTNAQIHFKKVWNPGTLYCYGKEGGGMR